METTTCPHGRHTSETCADCDASAQRIAAYAAGRVDPGAFLEPGDFTGNGAKKILAGLKDGVIAFRGALTTDDLEEIQRIIDGED